MMFKKFCNRLSFFNAILLVRYLVIDSTGRYQLSMKVYYDSLYKKKCTTFFLKKLAVGVLKICDKKDCLPSFISFITF